VKAGERFVLRVTGLLAERRQTQKSLRGDKSEGWISNIVKLRRALKLDDADEIANALEVPLSELVRRPEDVTYQLSGPEARLLDAYRQLAQAEQQSILTLATLRSRRVGRPVKKITTASTNRLISDAQSGLNSAVTSTSAAASLPQGASHASRVAAVPPEVQAILAEAEARIAAIYAGRRLPGGQDPNNRAVVTGAARRRRSVRYTHPDKAR
jgi:hypothetical protein